MIGNGLEIYKRPCGFITSVKSVDYEKRRPQSRSHLARHDHRSRLRSWPTLTPHGSGVWSITAVCVSSLRSNSNDVDIVDVTDVIVHLSRDPCITCRLCHHALHIADNWSVTECLPGAMFYTCAWSPWSLVWGIHYKTWWSLVANGSGAWPLI